VKRLQLLLLLQRRRRSKFNLSPLPFCQRRHWIGNRAECALDVLQQLKVLLEDVLQRLKLLLEGVLQRLKPLLEGVLQRLNMLTLPLESARGRIAANEVQMCLRGRAVTLI
jgi:hypothetical protein